MAGLTHRPTFADVAQLPTVGRCGARTVSGRLDPMNINEIAPTATTFLAEHGGRFADHDWNPWFLLIPLTFWTLVIIGIVYVARRFRGSHGIRTLRDSYAKGEVTEAEYRERLAVLRETRR
ncbi:MULTISPECIES: SHOCT domain-containing protein [unclassified Mycobacterium]|uniref:SHOCT domain-containing protein n=1 Tax=unclassified Mycobacterium TaxID=2642494 RepID=UPI0012E3D378|nr:MULTISPECIES: SHOCT domain-containing protein [unclassified Mycobacterium]